jgi:hypothetical protein
MEEAVKRLERAVEIVFIAQLGEEPALDPDNEDLAERIIACAEELEAMS